MNKRGDVQRLRGVLRLGALVFAISSLVLFLAPRVFTDLLGIAWLFESRLVDAAFWRDNTHARGFDVCKRSGRKH